MIRAFEERDYEAVVAIGARVNPQLPPTVEMMRYRDRTWSPEHRRLRLVAERDNQVVGWGQISHIWWAYHPRRFVVRVEVDPPAQGTGVGSQLHERLLAQAKECDAELVRAHADGERSPGVEWLQQRGYTEIQRLVWLHLDLSGLDSASAPHPYRPEGVRITTMAEALAERGDRLVRELYDLDVSGGEDEPRPEQDIAMSFDRFLTQEIETPQALPDGSFVAFAGDRAIGVTRLERDFAQPEVVGQGFTTVHRDFRGQGIAFALKRRAVRYAVANGYREIRTANDATNAPMLHINQALGFRELFQRLIFEKRLD